MQEPRVTISTRFPPHLGPQRATQYAAAPECKRTVGHRQCLLRNNRFTPSITIPRIGRIKERQELHCPAGLGIVSKVQAAAGRRLLAIIDLRTTDPKVEFLRNRQQAVPDHFGLVTSRLPFPPQPVVRIHRSIDRSGLLVMRGHTVTTAQHDQPMQVFHRPVPLHQLDGQPIQEFRVRGRSTCAAEIKHALDQRSPEVPQPNVVDRNPRR